MADKQKRRTDYEILQDDLQEYKKDGLLDNPSKTFMQKLTARINETLRTVIGRNNKQQQNFFSVGFRKNFFASKKDLPERHAGLRAYKLKELDAEFQRAYKTRMQTSLDLIKTNNEELMLKLRKRLLDWITVSDFRTKSDLKEAAELPKDKHTKFILRDQSNKMSAAMDSIIADRYQAIAFQWKTRDDQRVVGRPAGLYPNAKKDSKVHGDHWSRRNKFYYYSDLPKEIKRKLNLRKFAGNTKTLADGMPGIPIGCRCYAKNFYFLEDLPPELVKQEGE